MVKITVNGREIDADPKKPLIHACHSNDVDVPMYCYHPGLEPVGSCRICQVEVKQGEAPGRVVVACRTYPAEGMVVNLGIGLPTRVANHRPRDREGLLQTAFNFGNVRCQTAGEVPNFILAGIPEPTKALAIIDSHRDAARREIGARV